MADENENENVSVPVDKSDDKLEAGIMITRANEAAARLEAANKELSSLIAKQERLKVEATFGGSADAGSPSVSKEDKDKEAARSLLVGSGYEDVVDFDGT